MILARLATLNKLSYMRLRFSFDKAQLPRRHFPLRCERMFSNSPTALATFKCTVQVGSSFSTDLNFRITSTARLLPRSRGIVESSLTHQQTLQLQAFVARTLHLENHCRIPCSNVRVCTICQPVCLLTPHPLSSSFILCVKSVLCSASSFIHQALELSTANFLLPVGQRCGRIA